jgi:hypothetical protein
MSFPLNRFSRRAFLRLSATLSAAVGFGSGQWPNPLVVDDSPPLARAFGLTTVYAEPDLASVVNGSLAPHSVHAIQTHGTWYQTEHGFVPRTAMQPIRAYLPPVIEPHNAAPFWAEVIAPVSTSRAWCSAKAPIVLTWGHGAVAQILGTLTDDYGVVWYETSSGWFDARQWQRVDIPNSTESQIGAVSMAINPDRQQITVLRNRLALWQTTYYGGLAINQPLTAVIAAEIPGDGSESAWLMRLDTGIGLRGAWHHNNFGMAGGADVIELPVMAAKRLYMEVSQFRV